MNEGMTKLDKYILLVLLGGVMLLASCSGKHQEDDSWYKPSTADASSSRFHDDAY